MKKVYGIICASEDELQPFIDRMDMIATHEFNQYTIVEGSIGSIPKCVCLAGFVK